MKNNNNEKASVFAYPRAAARQLGISYRNLTKWRREGIIQESSYFRNKEIGVHLYHVQHVARDLLTWRDRQKASHGQCPDCVCSLEKGAYK
jgi:hypothetical protein